MASKVTYTLDEETVGRIRKLAERSRKPQSQIVREAIAHYAAREHTLTDDERERKLVILREMASTLPARPHQDVNRELGELRKSRRVGWHRRSDG